MEFPQVYSLDYYVEEMDLKIHYEWLLFAFRSMQE